MSSHTTEILRAEGRHRPGAPTTAWIALLLAALVIPSIHGAIMGAWSERPLQIAYSMTKVPLLLVAATLVCLPNFLVVNTLLGLREDLKDAFRGVLAGQATLGITLAALSPLIAVVYLSGCSYPMATLSNGLAFLIATLAGQWTLARHYRPLIQKNTRHRVGLVGWLLLYQFVSIQLAWSLRPFIGSPDFATTYFRTDSWTNAYVDAVRAMMMAL